MMSDHDPEFVAQTKASEISVEGLHLSTAFSQVLRSTTLMHTDGSEPDRAHTALFAQG